MPINIYCSPLRYPGGKRKLSSFIQLIIEENRLQGRHYVEPYCGGAAVGLALLFGELADEIHINDLSRSVYAFWHSVLHEAEALCKKILCTSVNTKEWKRQREIQEGEDASLLELGFSTFFLNRVNRSGILKGGLIGGKKQDGAWKLDARFNREDLVRRIRKIVRYSDRIHIYNMDASAFLSDVYPDLPPTFTYLDPPYYTKGDALYANWYEDDDHKMVAAQVRELEHEWLVSYDCVPRIIQLYHPYRSLRYSVSYSAHRRFRGREIMFFSEGLTVPFVEDWRSAPERASKQHWKVGGIRFSMGGEAQVPICVHNDT